MRGWTVFQCCFELMRPFGDTSCAMTPWSRKSERKHLLVFLKPVAFYLQPCAMDSDSAAKISQILQLTVMKICQSVVNYTDQLAVQVRNPSQKSEKRMLSLIKDDSW